MSNVLIGIIGVILFIGLALAGALFLGPRFQEATVNSKASGVVQSLSQAAHAINMYRVQEGKPILASGYPTNMQTLVDARYLKSNPLNPSYPMGVITVDAKGNGSANATDHVYTATGTEGDSVARSVCVAIERQSGASDPTARMTTQTSWETTVADRKNMGCFLYQGLYYAYVGV